MVQCSQSVVVGGAVVQSSQSVVVGGAVVQSSQSVVVGGAVVQSSQSESALLSICFYAGPRAQSSQCKYRCWFVSISTGVGVSVLVQVLVCQ